MSGEKEQGGKMKQAIEALKLAYRKHVNEDDSIGWTELGDALHDALCELIGDEEFVRWNEAEHD